MSRNRGSTAPNMHRSIRGHDWSAITTEYPDGPSAGNVGYGDDDMISWDGMRWRCARCYAVVFGTKMPQRDRRVHFARLGKGHPGLVCDEVVAYAVMSS